MKTLIKIGRIVFELAPRNNNLNRLFCGHNDWYAKHIWWRFYLVRNRKNK